MTAAALPPCGLYRTTTAIGDVPAGRLVYFHNHGEPGPGVYLPEKWALNRATFHRHGHTLPAPAERLAATLEPVPAEGFYRVKEAFYCCEKQCRRFEPDLFVQLGYDGTATPILFVPELTSTGIALPTVGALVSREHLGRLAPVSLAHRHGEARPAGGELH